MQLTWKQPACVIGQQIKQFTIKFTLLCRSGWKAKQPINVLSDVQSQGVQNFKFFGGHARRPPGVAMLHMHVCFAHTVSVFAKLLATALYA